MEKLVKVTDDSKESQKTEKARLSPVQVCPLGPPGHLSQETILIAGNPSTSNPSTKKPDTTTLAVAQGHSLANLAYMMSYGAKMRSPAYIFHPDIIMKALECRRQMSQISMARGTLQMLLPIRQVTPMFSMAKLHPLRCSAQPDVGRKVVGKDQQANQTGADIRNVAQVHVTGKQVLARQVVAMLSMAHPKLLPLKYTILPNIRKKVGDTISLLSQKHKERSKVRAIMKPSKYIKSVFKRSRNKMTWTQLTEPLSPEVALKTYQAELTSREQKEILEFPEIWYLGLGAEKMKGSQETQENSEDPRSSYDDEKGIYILVMRDHIAYRYEILEKLGQGSFGLVLKCLDHKTKELVALKIIHNMKSANHMALRELDILQLIRKKDEENRYNVIHMKEHMTFRKHLCITFELQGMDLYRLIRNNNFQGFTLPQTLHYAVALVTSLQMLHSQRIIHCDLKPENILLPEKTHGNIKVADFGCSFYEHQKGYTYVQTRFYRAPEVLLGLPFGTAIDMWSLGCILAELHNGTPLFPGSNEVDQLACIMEVLGMPPNDMVQTGTRRKVFFDSEGQLKNLTRRQCSSKDLAKVLKKAETLFVDFIRRCLAWDPVQRMTADEATHHRWIQKLVKMQ